MNVLTPELQHTARRQLALAGLRALAAYCLVVSAFAAMVLLASRLTLEVYFRSIVERSTAALPQYGPAFQNIHTTNVFLRAYAGVLTQSRPWTRAITTIADRLPAGIRIIALTINAGDGVLTLNGRAATRDDLLALQTALRSVPFLSALDIPFANFLLRERIDFSAEAHLDAASIGP